MTFIDLFAGIGGFRRGMEMAGHKCLGFCEFDKFAVASYTAMHLMTDEDREYIKTLPFNKRLKEALKEEYRHGEWYSSDIRRLRADDIPGADVWCFGFPCQDISVAGKQKGLAGNRSGLFHTVIKLLQDTEEENRPSVLFIENVKNLLSVNRGFDFLSVLVALDEAGYDAEWQVINSADYVPQNRERVFIVGHLRGRSGRKVFPVEIADRKNGVSIIGHRDGYRRNSQTYSPKGITQALDTATGGGRGFNVAQPVFCDIGGGKGKITSKSRCIRARYYKGMSGRDCDMSGVAVPVLTPDIEHKRQNGRRMKEDGEPMFSLTAQDRHGVLICANDLMPIGVLRNVRTEEGKRIRKDYESKKLKISRHSFLTKEIRTDEKTNTLDSVQKDNLLAMAGTKENIRCVFSAKYDCYMAIRKLTPKECFRLQGWEDTYFDRAALVSSDSQLYKQAGNGVTVPVIYEIARRF